MKRNLAIIIFLFSIFFPVYPFASAGTISSSYKYAWSNQSGYVNFENATVGDSSLGGYAWSSTHGWINLSPAQGGVLNDGTGNLSGYAWGEQLGWIDFNNVSIDSNGKFAGTATGSLIGTLTFDCANCDVRTDWRQTTSSSSSSSSPGGSSGGGSGNASNSSVSSAESNLPSSQNGADILNWQSWKNFYGINTSVGSVEDNARYAKQMGYDYVSLLSGSAPNDYKKSKVSYAGLKFYVNDPHWESSAYRDSPGNLINPRIIDVGTGGKSYTQAQKDWYSKRMVWGRNNQSWPYNFASGYHPAPSANTKFSPLWDFQQQAVIDEVVENIISEFKSYENKNLPFTFAGYIMDVPKLIGNFIYLDSNNIAHNTTIKHWTGAYSGLLHPGITHEYPTYSDGMAAFYKKLNLRIKQEFPSSNAKWLIDPSKLYNPNYLVSADEWMAEVKSRSDKTQLKPDFISQEADFTNLTGFVDDQSVYNAGLGITKDMVGSSQNMIEEEINRLIAAKAGINGAWYNWFLKFGGNNGSMPNFQSITAVYPRLKLIRVIPNWDNLLNVPLSQRSWDGAIYKSSNGYISSDVMYSHHWKNPNKLFAVFNTVNGKIKLRQGETVSSIKDTNGYFEENADVRNLFKITPKADGDEITFANPASIVIAKDSLNNQVKGNGYIFTLSQGQSGSSQSSAQSSLSSQSDLVASPNDLIEDLTIQPNTSSPSNNSSNGANLSWTTGKIGGALNFNGTSDYISLPAILPAFTEFTASAWVKVADLNTIRGIFNSGEADVNGFRFRINTDGSVQLIMSGGESSDILSTASGVIQPGIFYYITVVGKSSQYMSIYINGVLATAKNTNQIIDAPTAIGYVGSSKDTNSELMKGVIDEFSLYNEALTPADITQLYNSASSSDSALISGITETNSEPLLYYKLDEKSGTVVIDSSGNGDNGTLNINAPSASIAEKIANKTAELVAGAKTVLSDSLPKLKSEAIILSERLEQIQDNLPQKTALSVSAIVATPVTLGAQYLIAQANFIPVVSSLSDLWLMFIGSTQGILTSLGLRKRRRYWGVVYDSRTKQPIDPALVELIDEATGKVVRQSITDISGRFGFLDYPGTYRIRASKTHYVFPSRLITGSTDSIYENVYLGGVITVSEQSGLITPNIPMDAVAFDWNQEAKQKIVKFHPRLEMMALWGLTILFWSGFAFTAFNFAFDRSILNSVFTAIYALLIVMKEFVPHRKLFGRVESKSLSATGLKIEISLKDIPQITFNQTLTKRGGKFFMMAPKGEYILRVKQSGDSNATTLFESDIFVDKIGVVNNVISI